MSLKSLTQKNRKTQATHGILKQVDDLIRHYTGNSSSMNQRLRIFVDFFDGDKKRAYLMNQILYWSDRTSNPERWFYKTHDQWKQEEGFTKREVHRIVYGDPRVQKPQKTLSDVGVETKVCNAPNNRNAVHYRVEMPVFIACLHDHLERVYEATKVTNGHFTELPMVTSQSNESSLCPTHSSLYDSTKNTVTEITSQSMPTPHPDDDSEKYFQDFRKNFGIANAALKAEISAESLRVGEPLFGEVVRRCIDSGGRSWRYVAAALKNEKTSSAPEKIFTPVQNIDYGETSLWEDHLREIEAQRQQVTERVTPEVQQTWDAAYQQIKVQHKGETAAHLRDSLLVDFVPETQTFVIAVKTQYNRDQCQHRVYRNLHKILRDVSDLMEVKLQFVTFAEWSDRGVVTQAAG